MPARRRLTGLAPSRPCPRAPAGLGVAEAARRELAEADIAAIVTAEINDRRQAAYEYEGLGSADQSARLRQETDILAGLLAEPMTPPDGTE